MLEGNREKELERLADEAITKKEKEKAQGELWDY